MGASVSQNADGTWNQNQIGDTTPLPMKGCQMLSKVVTTPQVAFGSTTTYTNSTWDCGYDTPRPVYEQGSWSPTLFDTYSNQTEFKLGSDLTKPWVSQYEDSVVPPNTIKRGYDIYKSNDLKDLTKSNEVLGVGNSYAERCGFKGKDASKIYTTDGKTKRAEHRQVNCGIVGCEMCDTYPYQWPYKGSESKTSGITTPIGTVTTLIAKDGHNILKYGCDENNKDKITTVGWNQGEYKGKNWDPKIPDEIATGCSAGSDNRRGEYVRADGGYQIPHDYKENIPKDDRCFLGTNDIKQKDSILCTKSEVDWPTFCQLGDFIESQPECNTRCVNVVEDNKTNENQYCHDAYERYCEKKTGDKLKRDPVTKDIVLSDNNKIKDSSVCLNYCGAAQSPKCKKIKTDICTRSKEEWKTLDWLPDYCKTYWSENMDRVAADNVCEAELLDPLGAQNVFSRTGCGKLCDHTDVNETYCRDKKTKFCTANDTNMLTDNCINFCSNIKNKGACDKYLGGEAGMCTRLGIKSEEDLDKYIPGTQKQYSDLCGCMMNTDFYETYIESITKKYKELGYDIASAIDVSPECAYPKCKQGSAMTLEQANRIEAGLCKDCVQIMFQNLSGSFVDSEIAASQSANCDKIKQTLLLEGIYKITNGNYINVSNNGFYCIYPNKDAMDKDNKTGKEVNNVDKIPESNKSEGLCELGPGDYYVDPSKKYIRVNMDGTYCIYTPSQVSDKSLDTAFSSIPKIPKNNMLNVIETSCIVIARGAFDGIPLEIGGHIFSSDEKTSFFGSIIGVAILILLISIFFIIKTRI